jgi:hypothetical protein
MTPLRFKPTISAGERLQTYALGRAATGTGTAVGIERYSGIIYIPCNNSSVGIAIDYGLDGPGIESRWG